MKKFAAVVLGLCGILGLMGSVSASAGTPKWRILWAILPRLNATYNGEKFNFSLTNDEIEVIRKMSERTEDFIETASDNAVDIEMTVVISDGIVTSLSNGGASSTGRTRIWIAENDLPSDITQEIHRSTEAGTPYDLKIITTRLKASNYDFDYGGLTASPYSFVRIYEDDAVSYFQVSDIRPHPEEIWVHELIHGFEGYYLGQGYSMPSPDHAKDYGYSDEEDHTFCDFYGDILAGKLKDPATGELLGIKPDMWQYHPGENAKKISDAPLILTENHLFEGVVGNTYQVVLTTDGMEAATWSCESGTLPAGLTLDPSGILSGKPTQAGDYNFTVKAQNSKGYDIKTLTLSILETFLIDIDNTHFPDENFRKYIREQVDDGDGMLSKTEMARTTLDVSNQGISNLMGIRYFTALTELNCSGNNLIALDLTNFTSLRTLYCGYNNLSALDLSTCEKLVTLDCSGNKQLENLDCHGLSKFTTLKVDGCTALRTINCSSTQIASLNISSLGLNDVHDRASLRKLDVSNCKKLKDLSCTQSHLGTLNISGCEELTTLFCAGNALVNLDLSGCTALKQLICRMNLLTTLDVGGLSLTTCYVDGQSTTGLKLTKNDSDKTAPYWLDMKDYVPEEKLGNITGVKDAVDTSDLLTTGIVKFAKLPEEVVYYYKTGYQANGNDPTPETMDVTIKQNTTELNIVVNSDGTLPKGTVGKYYAVTLETLGAKPDIWQWSAIEGVSLPLGLSLETSKYGAGIICGIPKEPVISMFEVRAIAAGVEDATKILYITIESETADSDIVYSAPSAEAAAVQQSRAEALGDSPKFLDLAEDFIADTPELQNIVLNPSEMTWGDDPSAASVAAKVKEVSADLINETPPQVLVAVLPEVTVEEEGYYLFVVPLEHVEPDRQIFWYPDYPLEDGKANDYYFVVEGENGPVATNVTVEDQPITVIAQLETGTHQPIVTAEATDEDVEVIGGIPIDEAHFPDANFRAYLSSAFDVDKNGVLSNAELAQVTRIDVSSRQISNLKGIEVFAGLKYLQCSGNTLRNLDVSRNTALEELYCSKNNLASLSVNAGLITLDVSDNTALRTLLCRNMKLAILSVSGCTALTELDCSDDELTTLNVSGCTNLSRLNCDNNQLATLDVSECPALGQLVCSGNQLKTLDVSKCTELLILTCSNNHLSTLNVSGCTKLANLSCSNNQLTTLEIGNCAALEYLSCANDQLTELNVSGYKNLGYLDCSDSQLTTLNVSGCPTLYYLACDNGRLTVLNVSDCTALQHLSCSNNQLTALDVSKCPSLTATYVNGQRQTVSVSGKIFKFSDLDFSDMVNVKDIKADGVDPADISGTVVTFASVPSEITYNYDIHSQYGYVMDVTLTVNSAVGAAPEITTTTLPDGTIRADYGSVKLTATGEDITWSADGLPDGLSLDSATGLISGTPTETGDFTVTVTATNSAGHDTKTYTLTINTVSVVIAPSITTTSLPSGKINTAYGNIQLTATGDTPTWSATDLPAGLSCNSAGVISGTPTVAGTFSVKITATNSAGADTATLPLTISGSGGGSGGNTPPANDPPSSGTPSEGSDTEAPSNEPGNSEPSTEPDNDNPSDNPGTEEPSETPGNDGPSDNPAAEEPSSDEPSNEDSPNAGGNEETRPNLENPEANDAASEQVSEVVVDTGEAETVQGGAYTAPVQETSLGSEEIRGAIGSAWPGSYLRSVEEDMDQTDNRTSEEKTNVLKEAVGATQTPNTRVNYAYALQPMRPSQTGIFTFALPLASDMAVGDRLNWHVKKTLRASNRALMAGVTLAADDESAVFIDMETKQETEVVPKSRAVSVSTYLDAAYDYEPVVLTVSTSSSEGGSTPGNGSNGGSGGGGCNMGLSGLMALAFSLFCTLNRRR